MHHDQVSVFSRNVNLGQDVKIKHHNHHIEKLKKYMIIFINGERSFNKFQHPFMIKVSAN